MPLTITQIVQLTGGSLQGPDDATIRGVEALDRAQPGQLTFIADEHHARRWPDSHASAALVHRKLQLTHTNSQALILVDDVEIALAKVLEALAPPPALPDQGVHPSAVIDKSAQLGLNVCVGPGVVVGPRAKIGDKSVLHPNVTVMADCAIGSSVTLWPGVVIRERCEIGDGSILHPNVTIGADGFGYRPSPDGNGLIKIPQIGTVKIGRNVEIGSNTCIDRGKFAATEIGDGCKIDNLIQIAHNCRLGRFVIIAGQSGIAGSVTIGDGVVIGGGCDFKDHLTIGAGAKIAGGSQVMDDVPPGETWAGSPAQEARKAARQYVAVRQLPDVLKKVRKYLKES